MIRRPPRSTLFPTRRSSDLSPTSIGFGKALAELRNAAWSSPASDRKSTRLNSSHDQISYAVFCLKKKKWWRSVWASLHATPEQRRLPHAEKGCHCHADAARN